MSISYNLLLPQDAQLSNYTVEEEAHYLCQIMTITGVTTSGYDLVITKLDTSLVAILSSATDVQQPYCNPRVDVYMKAEEILAKIGFKLPVKSEMMV